MAIPGRLDQAGKQAACQPQDSGSQSCSHTPLQQRAVPLHAGPISARHVQIGCVLVPRAARPLSHGSHAAAGQVVPVPSLEDSLSAAALALCQDKPLLLEGPPGALAWQLLLHAEGVAAATEGGDIELLLEHVPSVLRQGHVCCRYWRVCPAACGSLPAYVQQHTYNGCLTPYACLQVLASLPCCRS